MSVIPKGGNYEVVFHDGSTIPAAQTTCALSIRPGGGYLGALAIHPPDGGMVDTAQIQRGLNRGPLSLRIPVPPKWDESALLECSVLSQFVDVWGRPPVRSRGVAAARAARSWSSRRPS